MANVPVIPAEFKAKVPAHIQDFLSKNYNSSLAKALTAGGSPFAILSFKGKVWSVRKSGVTDSLVDDNDQPLPTIMVAIIDSREELSKTYYADGWVDGSDAAPDCMSIDGITPDVGVPHQQSETCGTCPHNVWGSKISPTGAKTKACQDNRRVAVIFENELDQDDESRKYGPLLLRVPPASFKNLTQYADKIQQMGLMVEVVKTQVGFDIKQSYPALTFAGRGFLSPDALAKAMELKDTPSVKAILSTNTEREETDATKLLKQGPQGPPVQDAPAPAPTTATAPKTATKPARGNAKPTPTQESLNLNPTKPAGELLPQTPAPQASPAPSAQANGEAAGEDSDELMGLFEASTGEAGAAGAAPKADFGDIFKELDATVKAGRG